MASILGQMANALGTMPLFDNSAVDFLKRNVLASGIGRTLVAAAATGAYDLYCQYIAKVAPFGSFLPALPLVGETGFNAPAAVLLAWGGLEIAKQIVGAVSTFRQNRSQSAVQQTLAERQAALKSDANGESDTLTQEIQDPQNAHLLQQLNALRGAFAPLLNNLNGPRTEAQLVQDREQLNQLKKVREKIFDIDSRIDDRVPLALKNEFLRLITGANQLDAGSLQATLESLGLLNQQLELRAKACEKILLLGSVQQIRNQRDRLTVIKLRQEIVIPQIANLEAEITQLRVQLGAIQAGTDGRHLLSTKAGRAAAKQAEIDAKKAQISQLRRDLLSLPGLSLQAVDAEIARLQQLPQPHTPEITARSQGYQQIAAILTQIGLLNAPNSEGTKALRAQIQSLPFLQPQALQTQIGQLDDELQKLPSLVPNVLVQTQQGLVGVRDALNAVVNPVGFGAQRQAFQAANGQIPAPLQPPAVVAPQPAQQPQAAAPAAAQQPQAVAPQLLPAAAPAAPAAPAAAAPAPVDFSIEDPANPNGPRIPLNKLNPFPIFPDCVLVANPEATTYDIDVPLGDDALGEKYRALGGMCFAGALSIALKLPHLVKQLPLEITKRLNDGAEEALFGNKGAGGLGIHNQNNPQYPREALEALKNLSLLFRNPGTDAITRLAVNLQIIAENFEKIKGLKPENKLKIIELLMLVNLRSALLAPGGNISRKSFKKLFGPFSQCEALKKELKLKYVQAVGGPASVSKQIFGSLENLMMGKKSDVGDLSAQKHKANSKHAVICQSVSDGNENIPVTFQVDVSGEKVEYRVIGVIETPEGDELAATTHTLSQKWSLWGTQRSWHRYDPQGALRVVDDPAPIQDDHVTFQKGRDSFSPAILVAVPV